jgi:hypothetical protein
MTEPTAHFTAEPTPPTAAGRRTALLIAVIVAVVLVLGAGGLIMARRTHHSTPDQGVAGCKALLAMSKSSTVSPDADSKAGTSAMRAQFAASRFRDLRSDGPAYLDMDVKIHSEMADASTIKLAVDTNALGDDQDALYAACKAHGVSFGDLG